MTGTDSAARAAARGAWQQVFDDLAALDADRLDPDDLERLGDAAFWTGRPREAIDARRRAYTLHRDAGRPARAATMAWLVFYGHFDLDEIAAASGWLGRARRDAAAAPDSVASGYVAMAEGDWALYNGDTDAALAHVQRAIRSGQDHDDRDLVGLSVAVEGRVRVTRGEVADGIALLDEAMVAATSGEHTAFTTGWVYCLLLDTCQSLGDVRRAGEWSDVAVRWCEERGQESWYPGLCRLHKCEIAALRGEWSAAEREAVRAAEELVAFGDYAIADGHYLSGEIRRRQGDYAGAERAFRRAHELGRDPQPGLALLRLAQGDAEAAVTALQVALAGGVSAPLRRAGLLAAHVQAALSAGDVAAVGTSADDLVALADATGMPLLRAMGAASQGAVLLAKDDVGHAVPLLREADAVYRKLSCPYESAQIRVLLGTAARRVGDDDSAGLEFEAATATFQRLGAAPDAQRAAALAGARPPASHGLTEREIEVLRLVASGNSNRAIAAELFISEHTVARHMSNIFGKLGVTSRSAATAFAFEHDLV